MLLLGFSINLDLSFYFYFYLSFSFYLYFYFYFYFYLSLYVYISRYFSFELAWPLLSNLYILLLSLLLSLSLSLSWFFAYLPSELRSLSSFLVTLLILMMGSLIMFMDVPFSEFSWLRFGGSMPEYYCFCSIFLYFVAINSLLKFWEFCDFVSLFPEFCS